MTLQYDNRQKTRVFQREQPDTAETHAFDEHIGFTQPLTKHKSVFDGISIAQVVAGAAAAATSMLLASKIGIAGSVIGAAVSSAVTVICSQLYRHALETSAEKLKFDQRGHGADAARGSASSGYSAGDPYQMGGMHAGSVGRRTRVAPADLRRRAAAERQTTQRKVIVVSVVLAAVAVALTAGIIFLGTAGEGLGAKPAPLLPAPEQQTAEHTPAANTAPSAQPAEPQGEQGGDGQSATGNEAAAGTDDTGHASNQDSDQGGDGHGGTGSTAQEPTSAPDQTGTDETGGSDAGSAPDASDGTGSGAPSGSGASGDTAAR